MKKLICGMLMIMLCLYGFSAMAETVPDIETQKSTSDVRWSYPISLTTLRSPYLLLVNKEMPLDKTHVPEPLVKVKSVKRATSADVYLEEKTAQALESMFEAAKLVREYNYVSVNSKGEECEMVAEYGDKGMVLFLKSGYRSYGTQKTTYTNRLASNNNVDNGFVAKPGESEHQTGYCADILNADYATRPRMTQDFKWTPEAQWMKEHCAEFGFILRFLEDKEEVTGIHFEPWHFRYVGKEAAGYIMQKGMVLEEFTDEWQFASAEFVGGGGDAEAQLAYELERLNAPPESVILDEHGEDGDAEVSLVF
ncbi:MAG: M15 family metallopeptidase [Clostridia bacterium]